MSSVKKAEASMVLATVLWGASYLFMKEGLSDLGVFDLITLRFGIAFFFPCLIWRRRLAKCTMETLKASFLLGVLLFLVILCVSAGVRYTSASSASFLCCSSVAIVPLLSSTLLRRRPGAPLLVSTVLSTLGIALLCLDQTLRLNPGDLLCLGSALFRSVQILVTERLSKRGDSLVLGILQLGWVALLSLCAGLMIQPPQLPSGLTAWQCIIALGVLCTSVGFILQAKAQETIDPTRLSVIFTLEPMCTALFSLVLFGQAFTVRQTAGAAAILAGVVLSSRTNGNKAEYN